MTDRSQAPVNSWQINQLALRWLQQAKAPDISPWSAYLPQLARWGLDQGFRFGRPLSPSQPEHYEVESLVDRLLSSVPPVPLRATEYLASNPNLSRREAWGDLVTRLKEANDPEEAAQVVLEAVYDRMVAASS